MLYNSQLIPYFLIVFPMNNLNHILTNPSQLKNIMDLQINHLLPYIIILIKYIRKNSCSTYWTQIRKWTLTKNLYIIETNLSTGNYFIGPQPFGQNTFVKEPNFAYNASFPLILSSHLRVFALDSIIPSKLFVEHITPLIG
jgi:hypothetical protein